MLHFILTRFNLVLWEKDKKGVETRSEEWLRERIRLFETYCLSSVMGQSSQEFGWIVLFDAESPELLREKVAQWQSMCEQLHPVWVPKEKARYWMNAFRRTIIDQTEVKTAKIITTYLDNDDALHRDYVKRVQEAATSLKPNTFISFPTGLQLFEDDNYLLRLRYDNNHFISLVEEYDANKEAAKAISLRTVMGYGSHVAVANRKGTELVFLDESEPRWLELVHNRNVINDVRMSSKFWFEGNRDALLPFNIEKSTSNSRVRYLFKHYPRIIQQICVHIKWHLFGSPNGKWGK